MLIENNQIKMLMVLVNYYNDDEVCNFIENELLNQLLDPFHIMVVNNGSHDPESLKVRLNDLKITLLNPGSNLGYLNAFLFAIDKFASKYNYYPSLMVLCNTDMYLGSNTFLKEFYSKYKETDYACIGPAIISTRHKTDQNPYMISRISKSKLQLISFVDNHYLLYLLYQFISLIKSKLKKHSSALSGNPVSRPVYALHGSFMMFSKLFISKASDDLKNAPFLFGEEVFIAEVARKNNMNLYYDSLFSIDHNEHATTGTFKTRKMIRYEHISISNIIDKYFN